MRKRLLMITPIALIAVFASMAFGAASQQAINEHETGTFEFAPGPSLTLDVYGTTTGKPGNGTYEAELTSSLSEPKESAKCSLGKIPYTSVVTLYLDAGDLVKHETGTLCANESSGGVLEVTGTATFTIAGGSSTGLYKGASGSGTSTSTFSGTLSSPIGDATEHEIGTVTLGKGSTLPTPPK